MLNLDETALLVSSITHVTDPTNFPFMQRYRERETSGSGLLYSATKGVSLSLHPGSTCNFPVTRRNLKYLTRHTYPISNPSKVPTYLPILEHKTIVAIPHTTGKTITETTTLSFKALNLTTLLPPYTYHNIKCIDRSIDTPSKMSEVQRVRRIAHYLMP